MPLWVRFPPSALDPLPQGVLAGLPDLREVLIVLETWMRRTLIVIILGLAVGVGIGLTVGWSCPINSPQDCPVGLCLPNGNPTGC